MLCTIVDSAADTVSDGTGVFYDDHHTVHTVATANVTDQVLRRVTMFRRLRAADRQRIAALASVRKFHRRSTLFSEGDPSHLLYSVLSGRVKVYKVTPRGAGVILDVFGPGDTVAPSSVYESRPYPATAVAIETTTCLLIPRQAFLLLLESHPSLVRGLLVGLTQRLLELTGRLTELSSGNVEMRLARLFLKLAVDMGRPRAEGVFIPMPLSRQELADTVGTTIESSIRIMSRWGKKKILRTQKDGFVVLDRGALEATALG